MYVNLLTHSFLSLTHSVIHFSLSHTLTHSFTHSLTHSLTHSFLSLSHTHSLIHSLTHSLTHSFISLSHTLTHSLTHYRGRRGRQQIICSSACGQKEAQGELYEQCRGECWGWGQRGDDPLVQGPLPHQPPQARPDRETADGTPAPDDRPTEEVSKHRYACMNMYVCCMYAQGFPTLAICYSLYHSLWLLVPGLSSQLPDPFCIVSDHENMKLCLCQFIL